MNCSPMLIVCTAPPLLGEGEVLTDNYDRNVGELGRHLVEFLGLLVAYAGVQGYHRSYDPGLTLGVGQRNGLHIIGYEGEARGLGSDFEFGSQQRQRIIAYPVNACAFFYHRSLAPFQSISSIILGMVRIVNAEVRQPGNDFSSTVSYYGAAPCEPIQKLEAS